MEVGSWIQALTLVVGWKYYDLLWQLMIATGIVFIPIVALLINTFIEARSRASLEYIQTDSVLARFEGKLMVLFLVFFFCCMPSSVSVQGGSDIALYSSPNDLLVPQGTPQVQNACDIPNNSTARANQPLSGAPANMCTDSVNMPIWWWMVQRISQGLTMAVVKEAATQNNNAHRALVKFKHSAKIRNQETRNLLSYLQGQCFEQARALFQQRASNPANAAIDFQGIDISWAGATEFVNNPIYYQSMRTHDPVPGMPRDDTLLNNVDQNYKASAQMSRQNCKALYDVVVAKAWQEASVDANKFQRLFVNVGINQQNIQARVLEEYIRSTDIKSKSTTEEIQDNRTGGDKGSLSEAYGVLTGGFAIYEMTKMVIKTNMYLDVMIIALPMLQSYLLMFIVMALPFGFVMSSYSFTYILKATALVFSISFWPAIWAVVAWIDNELSLMLYPGGDSLGAIIQDIKAFKDIGIVDTVSEVITRLSHNLVSMSLYVFGPLAFSWVMATAGFQESMQSSSSLAGMGAKVPSGTGAVKNLGRSMIKNNRGG